jgi:hypothetical protein
VSMKINEPRGNASVRFMPCEQKWRQLVNARSDSSLDREM